jgi:NAD(P)-dependent dehydrogenase (short-subunit alcohol dehydrogenase family)
MEIQNKVVVVTGGAAGIGRALCHRFAAAGARRVVVVDAEAAVAAAREIGGLAVPCDVAREADVIDLVRETAASAGPIDLFCSNAGIMVCGDVNADNGDWQRVWEVNVMAHGYTARSCKASPTSSS